VAACNIFVVGNRRELRRSYRRVLLTERIHPREPNTALEASDACACALVVFKNLRGKTSHIVLRWKTEARIFHTAKAIAWPRAETQINSGQGYLGRFTPSTPARNTLILSPDVI
jgi:hypothetical protein